MARVFVSHASDDRRLAGELHAWLIEEGHEAFLDHDVRDGILVGEEWQQRLYERLRWADAVICLLTPAFQDSMWCTAEVGIAQAQGSRLLPVRAEGTTEHPLLPPSKYQYADLASDPIGARASLGEIFRRLDSAGGLGWADGRSPFPGLRAFEPDMHRAFFGRHSEVEALANILRSPAVAVDAVAVLVVGPSGCGKSSLVRGGLQPVMAAEPGWATLPAMVPGTDPVRALSHALAVEGRRYGLSWTVRKVSDRLDEVDGLTYAVDELLVAGPTQTRQLLLVVDQLEELLTLTSPAGRERFAGLLQSALAGPLEMVATLRADFLEPLLANLQLANMPTRPFMLRPLAGTALNAVVEGPAELAGISVDDGLVARLVADTATGDALPLLAFTLAQLADGVGRGGRLSAARYDQLGGVQGALIGQAEAAMADAVAAGGRTRDQVLGGLLRLVTVDEQGRPIRWLVRRDELSVEVRTELDAFVARRLLTTATDEGTVVVGVAHEAFLSAWPPMAEAISGAATALRARRTVEQAAGDWERAGRPSAQLWERGQLAAAVTATGAHLTSVGGSRMRSPTGAEPLARRLSRLLPGKRWALDTERVDLTSRARDFLRLSIERDGRRRARTVTILSVLLAVAVVSALIALLQQRAAQEQQRAAVELQRIATARELITRATSVRDEDPRLALLLGLAANAIHNDRESEASLKGTLMSSQYAGILRGAGAQVWSTAFAPDGRTLASGGDSGTVNLWDVADRDHPALLGRPLTGHTDAVLSVAFRRSGRRTLATGSRDRTVILWDVADRARPAPLGHPLRLTGAVGSLEFTRDGRTMATGTYDGKVILWDVNHRDRPVRLGEALTGHSGPVLSVAFTGDGRTLASGGYDGTVILWDVTDPEAPVRLPERLTGHSGSVFSVAFAPDGRTLATGSRDTTVILWDVADPDRPGRLGEPLTGHAGSVDSVTFAPDGRTLATGGEDDNVILWDVTDRDSPTRLEEPLAGHTGSVHSVAFAPDGRTLATGSRDRTVMLWDVPDRDRPAQLGEPLTGLPLPVSSVALSSDGHMLATGSRDTRSGSIVQGGDVVTLWDVSDPEHPARLGGPLTGHSRWVYSVAFAPDGDTMASSSQDGTVILWDLADPQRPARLGEPLIGDAGWVFAVAFGPDGRTLASGNGDGTVILWDVTDPERPARLGEPLTGHSSRVSSVAFTPNGRTLASGSQDGTVILWDVADPERPTRLGEPLAGNPGGSLSPVAFAANGRTLAVGEGDDMVFLWDVADPERPATLAALIGHTSQVTSVAFAPDGRTLVSGSQDGTVILWDVADPVRPARLGEPLTGGHTGQVSSVAFASSGRMVASGSEDGTVILWDLAGPNELRDHLVSRACALTNGGLTSDEWSAYVLGLSYQDTCAG